MKNISENKTNDKSIDEYHFVRYAPKLYLLGTIVEFGELDEKIKNSENGEGYCSIFYYTNDAKEYFESIDGEKEKNSIKGYDGPCYSPHIWFDIDVEDDLNKALELTTSLIKKLNELQIPTTHIQVYFSGHKGFHIGIPTSPFGLKPGIDFDIYVAAIAHYIAKQANVIIDRSIYNKNRLLRLSHTRHPKSGLFKTPLDIDVLLNGGYTIDSIKDLASNPGSFEELPGYDESLDLNLHHIALEAMRQAELSFQDKIKLKDIPGLTGDVRTLNLVAAFEEKRLVCESAGGDKYTVECPWHSEHTTGKIADGSTAIWQSEANYPGFYCFHAHCTERRLKDVIIYFGPEIINRHCEKIFDQKETKEAPANLLIKMIQENGTELFHDERNEAYAKIHTPKGWKIFPIRSGDFQILISGLSWNKFKKAISSLSLKNIQDILTAIAQHEGSRHQLHNRVAWYNGCIWVDFDGVKAIKIDKQGWSIVDDVPILFRSFSHQKTYPMPVAGGDPKKILESLNISNEVFKHLAVVFTVGCFIPDIAIPLLLIHGIQGSGKTELLRIIRRVSDPSLIEIQGPPKSIDDLYMQASKSRMILFDNLSGISGSLSDALCRIITGDQYTKRALYSDDDSKNYQVKTVLGISGINEVVYKPDLLDRSLIIETAPIPPEKRKTEKELNQAFEQISPHILGGVLDTLVKALAIEPTLQISMLPRLADFARWGEAISQALGYLPGAFIKAYEKNVDDQNQTAIDANPMAQIIIQFMADKKTWNGQTTALFARLRGIAESSFFDTHSRFWPKDPSRMSRIIKTIAPNLQSLGITVEWKRNGQSREIILKNTVTPVTDDPEEWK